MKRKLLLVALLVGLSLMAGCGSDNFVTTCKVSSGAIGMKIMAVQLGVIDKPKAVANVITVKGLELCIDGWYQSLIDGNTVSPEQVACAINVMNQLSSEAQTYRPKVEAELKAEYGVDVKMSIPSGATNDEIENAYNLFKNACQSYYWTVGFIYGEDGSGAMMLRRPAK